MRTCPTSYTLLDSRLLLEILANVVRLLFLTDTSTADWNRRHVSSHLGHVEYILLLQTELRRLTSLVKKTKQNTFLLIFLIVFQKY